MKALGLHCGSRKEGPLTCDGPEEIDCCGGGGVIKVGMRRYSCVAKDYE